MQICRYKADYGLFRFCIADSEHDWREGSEQYKFIEHCLATIDRKHQPWLIFSAHRPLDYSSNDWYGKEGSFEEPMGRESLQRLWQKYKVDIAYLDIQNLVYYISNMKNILLYIIRIIDTHFCI